MTSTPNEPSCLQAGTLETGHKPPSPLALEDFPVVGGQALNHSSDRTRQTALQRRRRRLRNRCRRGHAWVSAPTSVNRERSGRRQRSRRMPRTILTSSSNRAARRRRSSIGIDASREHVGAFVQMDGSHHDWFEGRRPWAVLMVMIDDASKRTYARFFASETTEAAFTIFKRYVEYYDLPLPLYVDKASIYRPGRDRTVAEELAGDPARTQFGRAMAELGVELICANSPQAKGRVERRNGVFQDRLVKALRLEGISDLDSANAYLEESFLPDLNARFTVAPKRGADLHRRLPGHLQLDRILVFQEERVVQKDWTVRWRNRWFPLTAANGPLGLAGKRVLVCEQLDGTIRLRYRERERQWQELAEKPARPQRAGAEREEQGQPEATKGSWTPPEDHPWRRPYKRS
jgi:hypothetical protein